MAKQPLLIKLLKCRYFFLVLAILVVLSFAACSRAQANKLSVVTGTSLVEYIVKQVGGDRVAVTNLVPPASHPGDFNASPSDVEKLAKANLFILQGLPGEGYADKLIASAANSGLTVGRASVNGNWMVPAVQQAAADRIAQILSENDAANAANYQSSAVSYKSRVQSRESDLKEKLTKSALPGVKALCSVRQVDFLKWAGVDVVATYGGPETLTPQSVKTLLDQGRAAGVTLVVDNLQDGKDAGKGLAEELQAVQINLSNFPGGVSNTETWEKAIERNVDLLIGTMPR